MMDLIASISVKIQHSSGVYCPALMVLSVTRGLFREAGHSSNGTLEKWGRLERNKGKVVVVVVVMVGGGGEEASFMFGGVASQQTDLAHEEAGGSGWFC